MYYPKIEEFKKISEEGNLIPVYTEILADTETPVSAYLKLCGPNSFLLESVMGGEKWARYSFLGVAPEKIIRSYGNDVEIITDGKSITKTVPDPIEVLRAELSQHVPVKIQGLPRFYGGLVGYIGYECVRFFESVPVREKPSLDFPDSMFMLMDTIVIFDNLRQAIKVVANASLIGGKTPEESYKEATAKIDALVEMLKKPSTSRTLSIAENLTNVKDSDGFKSSFVEKGQFLAAVEKSKEYIRAGDAFQIVVSQRFEADIDIDPFDVYRCLRVINPSPYMFYLNFGDIKIVGSSPEILVRVEDGKITLRPIAGTRKRGRSSDEDSALEVELKADPKERAEHIMLVDLGRNDVGRVAVTGSVKVTELMDVERYSHVMHIVSNVEGVLREGLDSFDVLRACFPAGTVTGAPKVRAMEIIDELEPVMRGPYAGAVGYFGFSGSMDTCITIRTILITEGKVYVQAGAGIVADSVAENEYDETVNKAKGMFRAVNMAKSGY
ncbi:MAG: anthranilate synthase component I [Nitrospirae bacterium]|nr:anthranilate synthase component I [Nitrospirota bacterium]MBF0534484.1 anthranilate synthase component I [Nitrospirota bacterium]MBF0617110.1 anthranilate synthase component I [Nitrospirota bacterium]